MIGVLGQVVVGFVALVATGVALLVAGAAFYVAVLAIIDWASQD